MGRRLFPLNDIAGRSVDPGQAVFVGNVGCESVWESPAGLKFPYVINDQVQAVVMRCDELLLYVADPDDTVVLRQRPDPAFVDYLGSLGLTLPHVDCPEAEHGLRPLCEIVADDRKLLRRLADAGAQVVVPYAGTAAALAVAESIGADALSVEPGLCAMLNDKSWARSAAVRLGLNVTDGCVCDGIDRLVEAYAALTDRFCRVVLKELHGVSGRGLMLVDRGRGFEHVRRTLLRRATGTVDRIIIEGWYDIGASLNCQFVIGNGCARPHFCGQQLLQGGMFVGSLLPASAGVGCAEQDRHMEAAALAAGELARLGYRGVAGIDTVRTVQGELFPVIEINARFNFSTYFHSALRLIGGPPAAVGRWYELHLVQPLQLEQLLDVLGPQAYTGQTGRGYMILTFGSVNANVNTPVSRPVPGRVFILAGGEDADDAAQQIDRIGRRVSEFNAELRQRG